MRYDSAKYTQAVNARTHKSPGKNKRESGELLCPRNMRGRRGASPSPVIRVLMERDRGLFRWAGEGGREGGRGLGGMSLCRSMGG